MRTPSGTGGWQDQKSFPPPRMVLNFGGVASHEAVQV